MFAKYIKRKINFHWDNSMNATYKLKPFWPPILVICAIGTLFSLIGYTFGTNNQIEAMPLIMHAADPNFIPNDFFVNVNAGFGPRFYYAHSMAMLSKILPIPLLYFLLTLISNISVAGITYKVAKHLFNEDRLVGFISTAVVMSIKGIMLGDAAIIRIAGLRPGTLILPLVLLSLWLAIRQKPIWSAVCAGLASLIHPLLGLEGGFLALTTLMLIRFLYRDHSKSGSLTSIKNILTGLLIFSGFAAFSVVPMMELAKIDSRQFIEIVGYFRNIHHYIPSSFEKAEYRNTLLFVTSCAIAFVFVKEQMVAKDWSAILIMNTLVLLGCLGGYLFVEIWPSRLWLSAQLFRLLLVPKWFGFILLSGLTANWIQKKKTELRGYTLLVAFLSPVAIAIPTFSAGFRRNIGKWGFAPLLSDGLTLVLTVFSLMFYPPNVQTLFLFTLFVFLVFSAILLHNLVWRTGLLIGIPMIFIAALLQKTIVLPLGLEDLKPRFTFEALGGDDYNIARVARQHSAPDDLFLVPPDMGQFRVMAERSIVVDFKCFPFQDSAMVAWRNRLIKCYGATDQCGFKAALAMDRQYYKINDIQLSNLRNDLNINFAILYKKTKTNLSVLYENNTYKMIDLNADAMRIEGN